MNDRIIPLPRAPLDRARSTVPAWVRAGFRLLSRTRPDLAGRLALRIFLRPPRPGVPPRERVARSEATMGWLGTEVGAIRTYRWSAGPFLPWENRVRRRPVLLAHGWGGRGTQLASFRDALRAAGSEVVAFDAPAHGDAPGREFDVLRYASVLKALDAAHGPFEAVVAHSMGVGAVTMALADGFSPPKAVLVGGPSALASVTERFGWMVGLNGAGQAAFEAQIASRFGQDVFRRFDVGGNEARLRGRKALVVHDLDDAEVPFEEGRRLSQLWEEAELVATAGLGHRRILRDAAVIDVVTRFVTEASPRPGTALPSRLAA